MPTMQALGDQGIQVNAGGAMQSLVPAAVHNLPTTVAASGHATSNLIFADGMPIVAVGVTSTQAGSITVQRYIDDAGLVTQGPALSEDLTANVAGFLNITDELPFASFLVTITNAGSSTATLSNLGILLQGSVGGQVGDLSAPASRATAVTTSDSTPLATDARSLYVGTTGSLSLITSGGDAITFFNVPVGIFPIRTHQVKATGTTASNIVAIW